MNGTDAKGHLEADEGHINLNIKIGGQNRWLFVHDKRHLKPFIEATLKYLGGTTVDLTDAAAVVFNMKKENGQLIISEKPGSIVHGSSPEVKPSIVSYDWEEGDTDIVGVCYGEFVVTFSEAPAEGRTEEVLKKLTVPAKGDFEIRFRERLTVGLGL